jgi:hypothetical protein
MAVAGSEHGNSRMGWRMTNAQSVGGRNRLTRYGGGRALGIDYGDDSGDMT